MQSKITRVILDTNIWVSFLITKDFAKLDEIIFSKQCILVFSQELLDEFLEVVRRSKFRPFFSASDIESILETIDEYADFVKVESKFQICRDPKDNFLLSLSVDGKADFLLTGDKDLLELDKFGLTTITTMSNFLK
jgi:putative PIN family toxin of toxin-antitoxin system